ncbi:MAG: hypothetical protein QOG03_465 [Actinomycetota bacterium]|nr:hypothetical protein [Actinomycetota bacterium]
MTYLAQIRRNAIDGYLKAVRVPIDTGVKLVSRGDEERLAPAKLVIDRADAVVRKTVGRLIGDNELVSDGARREVAADERARALELKVTAEAKARQAEAEFRRRREQAVEQEEAAERKAEEQRRRVEAARQEEERKAADEARRRKEASRKIEGAVEKTVMSKARDARLEQLETETEALQKEEDALSATEKARRLKVAADSVKTVRKAKAKARP